MKSCTWEAGAPCPAAVHSSPRLWCEGRLPSRGALGQSATRGPPSRTAVASHRTSRQGGVRAARGEEGAPRTARRVPLFPFLATSRLPPLPRHWPLASPSPPADTSGRFAWGDQSVLLSTLPYLWTSGDGRGWGWRGWAAPPAAGPPGQAARAPPLLGGRRHPPFRSPTRLVGVLWWEVPRPLAGWPASPAAGRARLGGVARATG